MKKFYSLVFKNIKLGSLPKHKPPALGLTTNGITP
jgi:hypothetical protein